MGEILPVDFTSLRIINIVWSGIAIHWPCVERKKGIDLLKFLVLCCPWTEGCPYGNHEVRIILMYILHHLLRTLQTRFFLRF